MTGLSGWEWPAQAEMREGDRGGGAMGRVLTLQRWGPDRAEEQRLPATEATLAGALRAMADDRSAMLEVRVGRWLLLVSASTGRFSVCAVLGEGCYEEDSYPVALASFDLVGDPHATGVVPLVLGGQEMDYPRRYVVSAEQALAAASAFLREGAVQPSAGRWEQHDARSAWVREGLARG